MRTNSREAFIHAINKLDVGFAYCLLSLRSNEKISLLELLNQITFVFELKAEQILRE